MASSNISLRSQEKLDTNDLFTVIPAVEAFPKELLPLYKDVIGRVRFVAETKTFDAAVADVASSLHDHWVSRNIYPVTRQMVKNKLSKEIVEFRYLTRTHMSKRGETW